MPDHGQPLSLTLRPDLLVTRETFAGRTFVIVKDPLALQYFRLHKAEFAILQRLDGRRSLIEIQNELEREFAPQKFQPESMSQFVAAMHRAGLVRSNLPGQADSLLRRSDESVRRAWRQKLLSPLSLRLRGIDPTPAFDRLYPRLSWCFSPPTLTAACSLIAAALLLFLVYHAEVLRRLPTWQEFFTPTNLLLLLALTGAIKVLHELGHGLTCRHFGGEVPELGVMLLVFAPCLYCNVSDAWRLKKWQRTAVNAAGIFVELVLASLAAFGWWLSEPGLFHQLCLGTMFISGVSTLLINGNPLMRYDGYFLFSDLVETPNLSEKSSALLRNWAARFFFGVVAEPDPLAPERHRGLLMLYAVASTCYRFVLTFSITLFLIELARPYRLESLARIYAIIAFGGLIGPLLVRFARFAASAMRPTNARRWRIAATSSAGVAAVALLMLWPLPQCVWGTLEIEPRDVERIYVDVPGRTCRVHFQPGQHVPAGAVLAELENLPLQLEIAKLEGKALSQQAQLTSLRRERYHNESAALQIPELEESVASLETLLVEKRQEASRLTLRASRGGCVLPPAETPLARETAAGDLATWYGLPTDPQNLGAALAAGTFYCQIGEPGQWQALIVIDQTDVALLGIGQTVEIRFDEMPNVVVPARVDEISRRELSESPRHLASQVGGELATETDAAGKLRPASATYQVRVILYHSNELLRIGLRGTARIHVAAEPLVPRAMRWLARTFHFRF